MPKVADVAVPLAWCAMAAVCVVGFLPELLATAALLGVPVGSHAMDVAIPEPVADDVVDKQFWLPISPNVPDVLTYVDNGTTMHFDASWSRALLTLASSDPEVNRDARNKLWSCNQDKRMRGVCLLEYVHNLGLISTDFYYHCMPWEFPSWINQWRKDLSYNRKVRHLMEDLTYADITERYRFYCNLKQDELNLTYIMETLSTLDARRARGDTDQTVCEQLQTGFAPEAAAACHSISVSTSTRESRIRILAHYIKDFYGSTREEAVYYVFPSMATLGDVLWLCMIAYFTVLVSSIAALGHEYQRIREVHGSFAALTASFHGATCSEMRWFVGWTIGCMSALVVAWIPHGRFMCIAFSACMASVPLGRTQRSIVKDGKSIRLFSDPLLEQVDIAASPWPGTRADYSINKYKHVHYHDVVLGAMSYMPFGIVACMGPDGSDPVLFAAVDRPVDITCLGTIQSLVVLTQDGAALATSAPVTLATHDKVLVFEIRGTRVLVTNFSPRG